MRRLVLVALSACSISGCVRDPVAVERTDTTVTLIGLVRAGTDTLSVLLARVEADVGPRPETGAQLRIETPGGGVHLVERPGEACGLTEKFTCLQAGYPAPPEVGDVIRLSGQLASGAEVDGSTVVPPPPPLTVAGGGALRDTVRLDRWASLPLSLPPGFGRSTRAPGPFHGRVWANGEELTCEFSGVGLFIQGYPDPSSISLNWPSNPTCDPALQTRWDSAHVQVDILAFDNAFSDYLAAAGGATSAYLEDSQWGLEGVTGAFGAATAKRITIVATP